MAALDAGIPSLETVTADARPSSSAEADEIQRIQALLRDSPDLINSSDKTGRTLLQTAAAKGELAIAKLLLDSGAIVDGVKQPDLTPLHYAAGNGHKAIVDLLLARGAKVDARTDSGVTPLHLAALKGYTLVARTLLDAHASTDARLNSNVNWDGENLKYSLASGQTSLHAAVEGGYPAVVDLLLSKGAKVNVEDAKGRTPLSYAAQKRDEITAKTLPGIAIRLSMPPFGMMILLSSSCCSLRAQTRTPTISATGLAAHLLLLCTWQSVSIIPQP